MYINLQFPLIVFKAQVEIDTALQKLTGWAAATAVHHCSLTVTQLL